MRSLIGILFFFVWIPETGAAGPPFKTDDPQPVDLHHWEFYLASQQTFEVHGTSATIRGTYRSTTQRATLTVQ